MNRASQIIRTSVIGIIANVMLDPWCADKHSHRP